MLKKSQLFLPLATLALISQLATVDAVIGSSKEECELEPHPAVYKPEDRFEEDFSNLRSQYPALDSIWKVFYDNQSGDEKKQVMSKTLYMFINDELDRLVSVLSTWRLDNGVKNFVELKNDSPASVGISQQHVKEAQEIEKVLLKNAWTFEFDNISSVGFSTVLKETQNILVFIQQAENKINNLPTKKSFVAQKGGFEKDQVYKTVLEEAQKLFNGDTPKTFDAYADKIIYSIELTKEDEALRKDPEFKKVILEILDEEFDGLLK